MANWLIEILTDVISSDGKTRIAKGITKIISDSMLGSSQHESHNDKYRVRRYLKSDRNC